MRRRLARFLLLVGLALVRVAEAFYGVAERVYPTPLVPPAAPRPSHVNPQAFAAFVVGEAARAGLSVSQKVGRA